MNVEKHPLNFATLLQHLSLGRPSGCLYEASNHISFQALAKASQKLAADSTLRPGQRILLVAEPSIAFVTRLLAIWWAGALPLVVSASEWCLFSQAQREQRLTELNVSAFWSEHTVIYLVAQDGIAPDSPSPKESSCSQDPALILFTSGSSGQSKGVVLSHAGIMANIQAVIQDMNLSAPASVAIILPLHHSFALVTQLLLTLYTGGEIHLLPAALLPGERLNYLLEHKIQRLAAVPTHFRMLCSGPQQLPELKHITVAGAALDQSLAAQILDTAPEAELWVGYGLTEAGPRVTAISHHDPLFFQGSVGKPISGVEVRIQSSDVQVRSAANMLGYLDAPDLSAGVFTDGWLHSGDSGYLKHGYLFIEGRKDSLFISAGEKIAPLEIEHVLQACPGVEAVAVSGEVDDFLGCKIVAYIQGKVAFAYLRDFVRQHLPPEKRPQSWYTVESLPVTANGKLKRKELPTWPRSPYLRKS